MAPRDILRACNNQVAYRAKQTSSGRQDRLAQSRMTQSRLSTSRQLRNRLVTLQLVPARTAEEFDTTFASAAVPALSRIFALAVEYAAALDAAGIRGIDS